MSVHLERLGFFATYRQALRIHEAFRFIIEFLRGNAYSRSAAVGLLAGITGKAYRTDGSTTEQRRSGSPAGSGARGSRGRTVINPPAHGGDALTSNG
jgi:hypothetical protein